MAYLDYEGLQHYKDTENEQVAPVESSNTSANAYEIGKYFWYEGNYCKAKTPIAVGDAFVQNTNFTVVKIGDEIEKKANTDGYYDAMTVGNAEQIVATEGVEDSTPYVFRKAGGGMAIGNREADTLIGGTIAWNQLFKPKATSDYTVTSNEVTIVYKADGTLVLNGTASSAFWVSSVAWGYSPYIPGSNSKHTVLLDYHFDDNKARQIGTSALAYNSYSGKAVVANFYSTQDSVVQFRIDAGETFNNKVVIPQCFDLTKMFGTTIADYIYSLEQAHAGDGVAWFKNLFPNDYYAYDAGTLMSVNTLAHVTTGKNLFDINTVSSVVRVAGTDTVSLEGWTRNLMTGSTTIDVTPEQAKSLPTLPAGSYVLSFKVLSGATNKNIRLYSMSCEDGSAVGLTDGIPSQADDGTKYFKFTCDSPIYYVLAGVTTNVNSIVGNIQIEYGESFTTYEPYESHTYPLDSELTIRGIPNLDSNNNLYYDGDIYEADGAVTRKYGIVDLGTLNYTKGNRNNSDTGNIFYVSKPTLPGADNVYPNKGVSNKFVQKNSQVWENLNVGEMHIPSNFVVFCSTEATSDAFKSAMSGVYLVYDKTEPTTEQAEPYAANQVVSGDGIEEYVDAGVQAGTRGVSVPVGHNTVYQQDLRTKLQDAPDSPPEDGDYIMRRTNGHNTYAKGNFAETNGDYPNMTVGNAEQLVSTVGIEDKTPYNFRTSGGSIDIGDRETDMVVGGAIAWNQLAKCDIVIQSTTEYGVTYSANGDGKVTMSGQLTGSGSILSFAVGTLTSPIIQGHKYYPVFGDLVSQGNGDIFKLDAWACTMRFGMINQAYANVTAGKYIEFRSDWQSRTYSGTYSIQIFDLTQMFGSTIADYVYSLEQTTAGAGVAWFKALFPKPYYEYNAGELLSVNTSAHNMTGFNQWDEQWELGTIDSNGSFQPANNMIRSKNYIPCLPSTAYHDAQYENSYSNNIVVYFYDGNKTMIPYTGTGKYQNGYNGANGNFITPENTRYMRFRLTTTYGTTYNNDICINLSWDGERDGEYEPYVEYNYSLDSSLELRGVPKLDSANNLYYDGDTYESDGTVTRKYASVDLGTLTWTIVGTGTQSRLEAELPYSTIGSGSGGIVPKNMLCARYENGSFGDIYNHEKDKIIGLYSSSVGASTKALLVYDSAYNDATAFKTAMSGVYLVYELAEPTTETADPYQNPQIVDDFGTEEYVDYAEAQGTRDVKVPVGHETVYAPNLRAKLETAPDSPQSDGDYIVRQTNGENQYVPLIIPQELPNTPGTDGTYRLQAVVSGGTATLSWVSAT